MTDRLSSNPADYIVPLNINKLEGRMMRLPGPNGTSREILLVSGHHGMLERWWSLAENFADYGNVTMPDLPGFGGMDSFERIGKTPNIDAYADYLAAFVKLRFRRKKMTLVGVSYGFVVITRMLQKYPELNKKVDLLVSLAGFMHKDDFIYTPMQRRMYQYAARIVAIKPLCLFQRAFIINYPVVRFIDNRLPNSKIRKSKMTKAENDATIEFEARLWQVNDLRTNWLTISEFLNVDNCISRLDTPVIHVVPKEDHYLNNDLVREHMLVVFRNYKKYSMRKGTHVSSIIADKKAAGVMLPNALRRTLSKSN